MAVNKLVNALFATSRHPVIRPRRRHSALPQPSGLAPVALARRARPASIDAEAAAENQEALEQIEASITLSKERVEELKLEIEDMKGDRARQNAALIAAGAARQARRSRGRRARGAGSTR